jgi:hypothetical protein
MKKETAINLPNQDTASVVPKLDSGAHYRFQYRVAITENDYDIGFVTAKIDPYRIAEIYHIVVQPQFHAIKKLLCAGNRGSKDLVQDINESICALERWKEMIEEEDAVEQVIEEKAMRDTEGFSTRDSIIGLRDISIDKEKAAEEIAIARGFLQSDWENGVNYTKAKAKASTGVPMPETVKIMAGIDSEPTYNNLLKRHVHSLYY